MWNIYDTILLRWKNNGNWGYCITENPLHLMEMEKRNKEEEERMEGKKDKK